MTTNQAKTFVAVTLIAIALFLILLDIYVAYTYGWEDTISQITLAASLSSPALAFGAGFLCGHLFWPQRYPESIPPSSQL